MERGSKHSIESRRKMSETHKQDVSKRFWDKVNIKGKNECWLWAAAKHYGYGMFRLNGRTEHAQRVAFLLSRGILTEEKSQVLHKCDNPSCCNPAHLFAGNHRDNMKDMINKNRAIYVRGEKNGRSKLKEQDVMKIRDLIGKIPRKEIAWFVK